MRNIFIYICMLVPMVLFSQSRQELSKSDSLFALGVKLYGQKQYDKAIPLFEESDRIDKSVLDSTDKRRDYSAMWLASCYYNIGDTATAASIDMFYRFPPVDRRFTVESDSLLQSGNGYYGLKNYEKALECYFKASDIERSVLGDYHIFCANTIYFIADCYMMMNDKRALEYAGTFVEIMKRCYGEKSEYYAYSLSKLAFYNSYWGKNKEAINLEINVLSILINTKGMEHPSFAIALRDIAYYNYLQGNYSKAISLGKESLNIFKKIFNKRHPEYAKSLRNKIYSSLSSSLQKKTFKAAMFALSTTYFYGYVPDDNYYDYVIALRNQALYNYVFSDYGTATIQGMFVLNMTKKIVGKESSDYAIALRNMSLFNYSKGNYVEAMKEGTEALSLFEKLFGKEHPDYAIALRNMALYSYSLGNYTEAINQGTEALSIFEELFGKECSDYAIALSNLALYNFAVKNYSEAIRQGNKAINILGRIFGKAHFSYAMALNRLAGCYSSCGNHTEAINLDTEAANIFERTLKKIYNETAITLSIYNTFHDNFLENLMLTVYNMASYDKYKNNINLNYAKILSDLAGYYFLQENYIEAIRLETEAMNIRGKFYAKEHPDYVLSLFYLSKYYRTIKSKEAIRYSIDATKLVSDIIKETFIDLTANERNMFWEKYKIWFETYIHNIAYEFRTDSVFENGYNGILLSKGLLLNSEIEFSKLLEESGDSEVMDMYNDLTALRRHINGLSASEMILNVDSLERVAQGLERELVQRSNIYGDFTKNIAIDWRQVQQKLGDKDVAVEFVSFQTGEDSLIYAAYCLRKGMTAPRMYPLFEERQLVNIDRQELYRTKDIAELVWKPLEKELQGMKNIYFSPAGELYNIAIESVPCWVGDTLMSDKWNLYRLSSTRELALIKEHKFTDKAALYGGLEYDMSPDIMLHDSRKYTYNKRTMDFMLYNLSDSLDMREGVLPLPATKVEVEDINDYMQMAKIHSSLFTDTIGTETSFKALSGQHTRIIHVATHGFYWPDKNLPSKENLLLQGFGNYRRYIEDKAMTRSGLLFAGANNVLSGMRLPENVEDGVLTAKEISMIDLRGLDLVVLSACQTGLGEITGDGVMGLQRGFKKAGTNTLLMSLWNVDDEATRLLMTKFYANLVAGKNKFESLREAQRYVRDYEIEREVTDNGGMIILMPNEKRNKQKKNKEVKKIKPYQNPSYWAAFILLDAI